MRPARLLHVCVAAWLLVPLAGCDGEERDGQIFRRGWLSGEQIRLRDDRRYVWERWHRFGAEETLESGTWVQLGEMVSLVPGGGVGGARPAYVVRLQARDGRRFLYRPTPRGAAPAHDAMYERVE